MGDAARRGAYYSFNISRRSVLRAAGTLIAGASLAPAEALAAIARGPDRRLNLQIAHTGETFRDVYWSEGQYVPDAMGQIDALLRDRHCDSIMAMDPRLLDLLNMLQRQVGPERPFEVVSAYRTQETNQLLREEGIHAAKHSYHITGQAVDVRVPDVSLRQLYNSARALKAGGVGYYPRAHFVHLDVGDVRHWEGSPAQVTPRPRHHHQTRRL
jgi:uncharacterized protein YcbK (DUF882 family)